LIFFLPIFSPDLFSSPLPPRHLLSLLRSVNLTTSTLFVVGEWSGFFRAREKGVGKRFQAVGEGKSATCKFPAVTGGMQIEVADTVTSSVRNGNSLVTVLPVTGTNDCRYF
jgi:hypothetical protein